VCSDLVSPQAPKVKSILGFFFGASQHPAPRILHDGISACCVGHLPPLRALMLRDCSHLARRSVRALKAHFVPPSPLQIFVKTVSGQHVVIDNLTATTPCDALYQKYRERAGSVSSVGEGGNASPQVVPPSAMTTPSEGESERIFFGGQELPPKSSRAISTFGISPSHPLLHVKMTPGSSDSEGVTMTAGAGARPQRPSSAPSAPVHQ
jgi:hypothetical protein